MMAQLDGNWPQLLDHQHHCMMKVHGRGEAQDEMRAVSWMAQVDAHSSN